jgi:hypothetical protein
MWDKELILQRELEQLSAEQLRTMLHAETEKDVPDDDLVLSILHILEDREPDVPDIGSEKEKAAWKLFRKRVRARRKRKPLYNSNLLRIASLVLVVCLLFTLVPQQTEADNWWQRLTKWTDDFFGFFREEEDTFHLADYEFQTDNPGLQQVYDAVTEMGITIPAVPMWLPEGFELTELKTGQMIDGDKVRALFCSNDNFVTLSYRVSADILPSKYEKKVSGVEAYEAFRKSHLIMDNGENILVTWVVDGVECSINTDIEKEEVYKLIDSIYRMEIS